LQVPPSSVFVTGASGFIGQRLVSALLEHGHDVTAMIRPEKKADSRVPPGCKQIPVGLTDVHKLSAIIAQSSAVIYCAGSVRGRNPDDFVTSNIRGVEVLLEALEQSGHTPPILLLSSLAASRPHLSDYANSKYEGEQVLRGNPSVSWTILRPPAVYGPGDQEMLPILKMIRRGLLAHAGPREQRLSLLYVDDLANAAVSWLSTPDRCLHETYSIDDGTVGGYSWEAIGEAVGGGKPRMVKLPRTLLDIAAGANLLFSSLLGYSPMLTPGKVRELVQPDWLCDNREFTDVTGWKPRFNLQQGAKHLFG